MSAAHPVGAETYDWYPRDVPMDYGLPNDETLSVFTGHLQPGSTVADVAGGYGRFAVPLAKRGHHVTIIDIDRPHLDEADRRAAALGGTGTIATVEADILDPDFTLPGAGEYDAAFTTGFIYLAPPKIARKIFDRMSSLVRPGGLVVLEFATDRVRLDAEGKSNIGPNEHLYSYDWGRRVVSSLFRGLERVQIDRKVIDLAEPYRLHNKLLIAHGFKPVDVPGRR